MCSQYWGSPIRNYAGGYRNSEGRDRPEDSRDCACGCFHVADVVDQIFTPTARQAEAFRRAWRGLGGPGVEAVVAEDVARGEATAAEAERLLQQLREKAAEAAEGEGGAA